MSRRRRAVLMVGAAAVAAALGMALVGGYSASVSESYGDLRPVVVTTGSVPAGRKFTRKAARASLEVRQVPLRFAPVGTLGRIADAVGFEPAVSLKPGSYLTAEVLKVPGAGKPKPPGIGPGRAPVELNVSGAGALPGPGNLVDVLVTREGRVAGAGRTTIGARKVPLIAVAGVDPADAAGGLTRVVLGLTRRQAIALIDAESFARRVTVLPRPGR